ARIIGEHADQRTPGGQLTHGLRDLFGRLEEKSLLFEKRAAAGLTDSAEVAAALQPLLKRVGRARGQFRRWRLHDDEDLIVPVRKGPMVGDLALPPGRIARNELADVGCDAKMPHGIDRRRRREQEAYDEDRPSQPGAEIHNSYDY